MHKNKKVIENLFKKKIKLIKEYNKHYFDRDNPKVDDATYDKLKKELLELEKKHNFLILMLYLREKSYYSKYRYFTKTCFGTPLL